MRLTEYEKCSGIELSTADRDALTEVAPSITIASTPGSEGVYDLTAGSTVGVVQTDTLSVEIRPKLPIDRVLFLISYFSLSRPIQDGGLRAEPAHQGRHRTSGADAHQIGPCPKEPFGLSTGFSGRLRRWSISEPPSPMSPSTA